MILYMLGIVAWMGMLGLIAYKVGSIEAQSFIGTTKVKMQDWQKVYSTVVMVMSSLAALIAISWCALTEWGFSVQVPFGVGKRTVWAVMGAVLAVISFVVPYGYASTSGNLIMSPVIPVTFVVLFVLVGYWLSTIFASSPAYKYTPLLSSQLRRRKGGKN